MKAMKKLPVLLCASAFLFACNKEQDTFSPVQEWDPSRYLTGIEAQIEDLGTRATVDLDARTVSWEAADEVLVCIPEKNVKAFYKYDLDQNKFVPKDEPLEAEAGNTAYLYYPAADYAEAAGAVTYKMPAAVSGKEDLGDKNPMAATFRIGTDESAVFKNICSILRLRLTGERVVSSIVLTNDDAPIAAAAEYAVSWTDGIPGVSSTATEKTMTIEGPVTLSESTPTDFFFLLPPAVASMAGMKVTVNLATADAGGISSVTLTRNDAMTLSRNQIIRLSFHAGLLGGGEGTEANPYKIATVRDFLNLAQYAGEGYGTLEAAHFLGAHYIQTADIDFGGATISKVGKFVSASDFTKAFKGVYDGAGKQLAHIKIQDDGAAGNGLFAAAEDATFKNMVIEDITVQTAKNYVGGLVGYAKGSTIENCSLSGTVQCNGGATGGLVGYIYQGSTIRGCSVHDLTLGCIDTATGNNYGGIVGYIHNSGTVLIEDCHALSGTFDSGVKFQIGGILGGNAHKADTEGKVTIKGCTNKATIKGAGKIGGINGLSQDITIQDCINEGDLTLKSNNNTSSDRGIGGIVSEITDGLVESCVNKGKVTTNKTFSGGIVGHTSDGGVVVITKCINEAAVDNANSNSGGIAGYLQGAPVLSLCVNKGDFVRGNSRVGGLVGHINNADAWVINSTASARVISTFEVADLADGKNGAAGGLVGTHTAGHLVNCVHGDNVVINRKGTEKPSMTCLGGLVGHARGDKAFIQNCYSLAPCDKIGIAESGNEPAIVSNDESADHMGQIYGFIEKGDVRDCYALNSATAGYSFGTCNGTVANARILGNAHLAGTMGHSYNVTSVSVDGRSSSSFTLSDGSTTLDVTTSYPVEILNQGAALISGYSGTESLSWSEVPSLDYRPLPSALVALGEDFLN